MENERYEQIVLQKEKYRKAIAYLLDVIFSAMNNGAFHGKGISESTCAKKYNPNDLKYGLCPEIRTCKERRCPMSFEVRKLCEQIETTMDVCCEPDAAIIPFEASEIPQIIPEREYVVRPEWFIRELMRIIWEKGNTRWGKVDEPKSQALRSAFYRLLSLGISTIGYVDTIEEMNRIWDAVNNGGKIESVSPKTKKLILEANKTAAKSKSLSKAIKKAPKRALRYIVLLLVSLSMEYRWGHKYPSADANIYEVIIAGVIALCKIAMKIAEGDVLGLIRFMNSLTEKGNIISFPRQANH